MSISHRTNRLKLVGQPSVEQLQNGRYRLTVTCSTINSREDWYSVNKNRILPDFGSLQSAEMSIDGLAAREGEAYTDMRLTKVESGNRSGMGAVGDYNVELTYETLGSAFVQVKDDTTDYELNGLRRVTRTSIAEAGIDYAKTVGTSFIDHQINNETAVRCYLASYSVDDNDSFRQVQEVYVEAGTLSETLDNVSSQKAKVIETIGIDPVTPNGYSLASKQESDFEGFQTNRFTFLKKDVELSRSEDKVGSQLAITTEVFEPVADPEESGYSVARIEVSDVNGIPTKRFTFLKDDVLLSESEDKVGSQKAIIEEWFNPAPANNRNVKTDYSLAREEISDISGIPTVKYTFLKPSVLSESTDNVGSQKAKVIETFSEVPTTPSGYSLASEQVSDFEGIKTNRYTFLKGNVQLSESEDRVGSQLAISQQWFNPAGDKTKAGYSLASKNTSDFAGIKTVEFRFLKDNVVLSESEDKVGSQLAIVKEVFNGTPTTPSGYSIANTQESDFGGIPTRRYTFLKNNSILNTSTNSIGDGVVEVSTTFFGTEGTVVGPVISRTTGDVEGIPTITVKTLQDNSGQPISGAGVISEFQQYVDFTYPGEVSIATDTDTVDGPVGEQPNFIFKSYWYSLKPPVTRKVLANVSISFQADGNLGITAPLWSPTGWAKGRVDGLGTNFKVTTVQQTAQDKAFNQYTTVAGGDNSYSGTAGFGDTTGVILVEGTIILPLAAWSIEVSGGPGRPDGNTYTIDAKLTPAFTGADGTQYWKKTLVVATIPIR